VRRSQSIELAKYELDEMKETMEAAKGLNAEKNGVKISGVLDSVLQTQVAQLAESIEHKSAAEFQRSYDETLNACNGCHAKAGYKFIRIVRPIAPPVTNQSWRGRMQNESRLAVLQAGGQSLTTRKRGSYGTEDY
jgi:hypothetical protein